MTHFQLIVTLYDILSFNCHLNQKNFANSISSYVSSVSRICVDRVRQWSQRRKKHARIAARVRAPKI